jgi:hypothetical protein
MELSQFPDLGAMMKGYAHAAAWRAMSEFRQKLDFTTVSINGLDEILVLLSESPETELDLEVRLWGGYLGEVLRRRYFGSWEMAPYPDGALAVPSIVVRGSRLFPLSKVYRRLTEGNEEDIFAFFSMVTERLGDPSRVN